MIEPEREPHQAYCTEVEGTRTCFVAPECLARGVSRVRHWLRALSKQGKPVTLRPAHLKLVLLLALGNMLLLGLLGLALIQASRVPAAPSLVQPPVLPTPAHLPTAPPEPTPTSSGAGGAVAFALSRNGNTDLYALDQDTRRLVRLTHHPAQDRSPAWSPDGEYLAFASNRADNWDIYLLDLKSDVLIRLTHHPDYDGNPSWSPDGKRLAFESYRSGNLDVYVMTAGGDGVRPITTDPAADFAPAWAPEARALAFTSLRDGNKDTHVYLEDQDRVTNITGSPGIEEDQPSWSANGSRLAYVTGPQGQTSVQVRTFDWETLSANPGETEFFGTGTAPAWAPGGESLLYARARGGQSHLVAASMTGWALFHEVCTVQGFVDGIAWTDAQITPRLLARASEADARNAGEHSMTSSYTETVQPTPAEGVPHNLIDLPGVSVTEGAPKLSDAVDDSFNALRTRVYQETGWDYLAHLESAWLPLTYDPPFGHSRKSWSLCGQAFSLDQQPYNADEGLIALVREDIGDTTYWRVFLRAAQQDGTLGKPMRTLSWDLLARQQGGRPAVDGGVRSDQVPAGYYVDFTALAREYGWERVPSMWRWRHFWPDILWSKYRKTNSLSWWECMVSVLDPSQIESTFGPIPRREN